MYLVCLTFVLSCWGANADFPGMRRPPSNWNGNPEQDAEKSLLLEQIGSMIEHHARMRLLQQMAEMNRLNAFKEDKDPSPFYKPGDPRYYMQDFMTGQEKQQQTSEQVSEEYNKLKAPMDVNPKLIPQTTPKLPATGAQPFSVRHGGGVVQKPINMDDSIGVYMVAMIAGVSAAFTVAAIAIGLAWYTLRQRIKAAADVEYPAYGVTGPSKDLLYPSEKKFAQSVDMYHYQQQKQKKLSLEKQSNGETNDGFSDLEGEYEMEDGDYTVYECPGFAPTGEMEVKNPLFADEPITVAQKHQPTADNQQQKPSSATKKQQPKDISAKK